MPQRTFWATQHEVSISFTFQIDPTAQGKPPLAFVLTRDQAGEVMTAGSVALPPTIAEEAFMESSRVAMQAYVISSGEDAWKAFHRSAKLWWKVAEEQAQTR